MKKFFKDLYNKLIHYDLYDWLLLAMQLIVLSMVCSVLLFTLSIPIILLKEFFKTIF